ncbi:putative translaldolase [Caldibacillus thermoamylovorans]|uniref:Putative translaldolase n=1 Tax=Caldibacillus thermoamylovorans TaxID=35841 RepID=A0A090J2V3_9BACI|nr:MULTISPECIES: transaldolase [Bacillaceae]MCB5935464.1 transaldolase [Bacillus sp. DFI.2.34]MCB7076391.1 transaldolase [Caldibacillus thermoamylovorans]MED4853169.1 transaldolase [Caldifermentibacillus hisashii]CEE02978.1 putative translaldolase [Caldibacillus thermoamylovorans]
MKDLKIKLFADGAVLEEMISAYKEGVVKGFTTNPSLMKKAGITDYVSFAKEVITHIPDLPISFEVFTDNFDQMIREAEEIASWGDNVYVKIPITNSYGELSIPLIKDLSKKAVKLNVTAILTLEQVQQVVDAFAPGTHNIVSVFAGRIADTGIDPIPTMKKAAEICHQKPNTELLWASSRELLNIFQAEECNCDIITCTPDILRKLSNVGKDLTQLSLETVQMFSKDSKDLGFSIL